MTTVRRGWVEVCEVEQDPTTRVFEIYDWSEHHDSGAVVASFPNRMDAVRFAAHWADETGRKFPSAEVVSLAAFKEGADNG